MLGVLRGLKVHLLLCVGVVVMTVVGACADPKKLPTVSIQFVQGRERVSPSITVEVCSTPQERSLGLMYRKSLAKDAGMLFAFPSERMNAFWMKNTYLSLDMVFIDSKLRVVGVLEDVPPLNEAPRGIDVPSQYVVELAAGGARQHGVSIGAEMRIQGALPLVR